METRKVVFQDGKSDHSLSTVRQSYLKSRPIYDQRAQLIEKIPGFWPAVIEEAPTEIESCIQARDIPLLQHLTSLEVTRFELDDDPENGDPRSLQFTLQFSANEYIKDKVLEKRFWHRKSKDGWSGLVSEPVSIQWNEGKDLTNGLLDVAVETRRQEHELKSDPEPQVNGTKGKSKARLHGPKSEAHHHLVKRLEATPVDEVSLFAWFGYRGRDISAEESAKAMEDEKKERQDFAPGAGQEAHKAAICDGNSIIEKALALHEDEEDTLAHEIFPAGEELAAAISEDLFPGALKYFGNSFNLSPALFVGLTEPKRNLESKSYQTRTRKAMNRQMATCPVMLMTMGDVHRSASRGRVERSLRLVGPWKTDEFYPSAEELEGCQPVEIKEAAFD